MVHLLVLISLTTMKGVSLYLRLPFGRMVVVVVVGWYRIQSVHSTVHPQFVSKTKNTKNNKYSKTVSVPCGKGLCNDEGNIITMVALCRIQRDIIII